MSKFSPTHTELALVSQIFNKVDTQKLGILTGDVAVNVFGGAKLPPTVLGEIWSIADEDNNGWLPRKGVAVALRLIGWAQKGETITPDLVFKPGPLPEIEGYSAVTQQATGTSLPKSPPGLPLLTLQEKAKFLNIFNKAGPDATGLLSGTKARDIFLKSKLSNDTLLQIWGLADTQDRGALDSTDFVIAMYFIQALMSGQLTFVPTALPPGLYQQAGGMSNQGAVRSHMTGNSGSFSPLSSAFPQTRSTIQPQYTGQSQLLQPNHTGFSAASSKPPLPARPNPSTFTPQRNGQTPQWDLTPEDKASADKFFDELDTTRSGYIEGDVAVPFMLKSKLSGEDLARVWDLADINNDGKLTRDGFAIAMYLIRKKLAGVDLPTTLPLSLIPPSLRDATASSPFALPQQPVHQEPPKDLLWDDTPPTSAIAPPPHVFEPLLPAPTRSASGPVPTNRDPFGSSPFSNSTSHRDLLSDDDDPSSPLQDQSVEIGNTQNQLHSTNRALDTLKSERTQSDERLASQKSQLESLQAQLAAAKASYESETKTLATIRERYSTQTADIQKLREELIRAESDLSAIRVEKAEVEHVYLRDKEDTRDLQRKMTEASQVIEATKVEVEKAKKEAKQQKGLLAIAKKQLSAKEAEKAKADKELEEAVAEVMAITKERTDTETELAALNSVPVPTRVDSTTFAANHPLPSSPDHVIESDSDSEDEIPLADLAGKAKMSPKKSSIVIKEDEKSSFDDVFGVTPPSAEISSVSQPAASHSQPVTVEDSASAGVSAFDEAMRIIPNSATPKKQTLTFDSAFDDNFDFDSATNKPFPPPPPSTISAPIPKADVPTLTSLENPPSVSVPNVSAIGGPSTASESKPTFDEAFTGFDSGPSLALNSSFTVPASKPAIAASSTPPFPSTTSDAPPQVRPVSPPAAARNRSPTPQTSPPKLPRPSTSSSKETHEKVKESAPRHSKLSIRLPFGKKKKQQQIEPLPSSPPQHLSPPQDKSTRTVTPAVDEDVESVKQLTAMGFSRSVAIEALEKYDYDVQRALNNLLGSS
ncbi:hypothetical protein C0992_005670 [Termitomyces sp. T32_za158]|nr:hypothetical protein C0992_005670 [Termitomyces sp. T32_za158]